MSRIRIFAAAFAVAALFTVVVATPAAAHDDLIDSTPAEGERLAEAPASVSLTFTSDVLTLGAAVVVADESGRDWVVGEPVVDAGTVTVPLDTDMPVAGYEIRWRVVSGDGHPISGLVPFTVGDADPLVRDPADPSADPTAGADVDADQSTAPDQEVLRTVWIGLAGAGVAVTLLLLLSLFRRRARARGIGADHPSAPIDHRDR